MTMDLDRVGFESEPKRITWAPDDCSLYALSLGSGFDELPFVAEDAIGHPQRVFPTFVLAGVMADESASWSHPGFHTGDYEVHQIVHGEQRLELFDRVEARGDVMVRTRVAGIYDKGSGALVELDVRADHRDSGKPLFSAITSLFIRGEGGFGGPPSPEYPNAIAPDRTPDHQLVYPTLEIQSLLYRHGGHDPHPIHFDPEVARRGGMKAPILMGLNTLGMAGRALLHSVGGSEPDSMRSISGRFAKPAYNGDVLTTQIWVVEDTAGTGPAGTRDVIYRVLNQDGVVVLDRGHALMSSERWR
ncbi:MAG: MaoC family dehydratase N-terminal domain-containing protein [Deltaproteobacteria bacterium]|nr:MaoC family dehydratase N-terminal domain-containing protein [Deltaproteobacteria bacterium]MBW2498813.1 MaoC family dehydratase N-terminal domain-containing protein [Deltaproteobacteria bacterium]